MSLRNTNTIASHWAWQRRDNLFGLSISKSFSGYGGTLFRLGWSVSASSDGNTIAVGVWNPGDVLPRPTVQNYANIYVKVGASWVLQTTLFENIEEFIRGSWTSVSLSNDGNTLAIGQPLLSGNPFDTQTTPRVHVYKRTGTSWSKQTTITSDSRNLFGWDVSISDDGNTLAIGAPSTNDVPDNLGSIFVYTRSVNTWSLQQKITAIGGTTTDNFGKSLCISRDSNTIVVGADYSKIQSNIGQGAVYLFTRTGTTWTQQQKLTANDGVTDDYFGWDVSISSNGDTVVIGAINNAVDTDLVGSVYLFSKSGSTWSQQQKLVPNVPTTTWFGYSVSIGENDNRIIVGAPESDNGVVYIYTKSNNIWSQPTKLLESNVTNGGEFGYSVSMSSNSNVGIIGAAYSNAPNGSFYVYDLKSD